MVAELVAAAATMGAEGATGLGAAVTAATT